MIALASSLSGRAVAIAASAVAHVALFAAAGLGSGHASASAPGEAMLTIDVEVAPEVPAPPQEEEKTPEPVARNVEALHVPTHTHAYQVAPDHDDRPHDPSAPHEHAHEEHADEPAQAPAVVAAPASAPARFAMTFGGASASAGGHVSATGTATSPASDGVGGGHDHDHDDASAIVPESGVSRRARLVERAPLAYPFGAEDLEADVALELVVDAAGRVESARVTRRAEHGFDEAALAAVRKYRFTPAERTGTRVRVRMAWVVQFRLAR